MPAQRMSVRVDVDIRSALRALREIDREASNELRNASVKIVEKETTQLMFHAALRGRQALAAARSLRARRDRVPAIAVGGRRRVTSSKTGYAGNIYFGSEHGSTSLRQFPPHLGRGSYWFWKTLGEDSKDIMREWGKAYDQLIQQWRGTN